jgi:hypothetical protein
MDGPFLILLEVMGWIVSIMETSKFPCPSFRSNFNKNERNRRVDGILTAEEDNLYYSEEPISLTQMTILQRKKDPGYEPGRCGVYNESGRVSFIPWAVALDREQQGTLNRYPSLNKYGAKSLAKQIKTGRVKMQFSCENCGKSAQGVEPLNQCSRCMVVAYCSRECQVSHWKKHKYDCTRMKKKGRESEY